MNEKKILTDLFIRNIHANNIYRKRFFIFSDCKDLLKMM